MKILVPIKYVLDPAIPVRVNDAGTGIDAGLARMVVNPYDEVALEEALRLKERGLPVEILAVSVGGKTGEQALRQAQAMGADALLHVASDQALTPIITARALAAVARREHCDLVLIGRQGMGTDSNQIAGMLAALLDFPFISFAEKLSCDGTTVSVSARGDAGDEQITCNLPALVSVELTLNQPRTPKIAQMLAAKKIDVPSLPLSALDVNTTPTVALTALSDAGIRPGGELLPDVATLVACLKQRRAWEATS
jgi:electron transfer flavoprotein beta subunit